MTKRTRYTLCPLTWLLLSLLVMTGLLTACSADDEMVKRPVRVELRPSMHTYDNVGENGTRAWTPPSGYFLYADGMLNGNYTAQANLTEKTIGAFFTKDGATPESGYFVNNGTNWVSTVELEPSTYYLYGYIPQERGMTSTVEPYPTVYADGAVLTLHGLSTITPSDVCVVVGAKDGENLDTDNGLTTGNFTYDANKTNIFLLFDHIYASLRFRMKVDTEYNKLRTIKLKRMEVIRAKAGDDDVYKTTTATIRVKANDSSPIKAVTFTPETSSGQANIDLYYNDGEPLELTTAYSDFLCCFVPGGCSDFTLKSTYDVFDRAGNPIRQDCTAENKININSLFSRTNVERGKMYTVKLNVQPTYLYMLSDPDLDNPTVKVGE